MRRLCNSTQPPVAVLRGALGARESIRHGPVDDPAVGDGATVPTMSDALDVIR